MNYSTTAEYGLGSTPPDSKSTTWFSAAIRALRDVVRVPELAPEQRAAGDAAKVRALALHYHDIDPGFASDLYAAADRHEQNFEAGIGANR
jgi:hypothetical protein